MHNVLIASYLNPFLLKIKQISLSDPLAFAFQG